MCKTQSGKGIASFNLLLSRISIGAWSGKKRFFLAVIFLGLLIVLIQGNCFALTPYKGSNPPSPPPIIKSGQQSTSSGNIALQSSGQFSIMSVSISLSINNGAYYTNSSNVILSINGNADYFWIVNDLYPDQVTNWGQAYYFTNSCSWTLSPSDGYKIVSIAVAKYNSYTSSYDYGYAYDTITQDKTPPVANAGLDVTVEKNTSVTLYGGQSYDSGAGIAHYYWDDRTDTGVYYTVTHSQYGTYQHKLKVVDYAGNYAIDYVTVFVKDLSPPVVSISSPSNGSAIKGTIPLQFSATDNDVVARYSINIGGTIYDYVTSPYNFNTTSKPDGNYSITVYAYDAYGNRGEKSINLIIDNNPPSVTVNSPTTTYVPGTSVNINFTATDPSGFAANPYSIEIDGSQISSSNSYNWNTSSYSHASQHIITCKAISILNNTGSSARTVYIDKVNPSVSISSPPDGSTGLSGTININFTASDGLSGLRSASVEVYRGSETLWSGGQSAGGGSGSFSFPWNSDPYDGSIRIRCSAYDVAGNQGYGEVNVTIINPPPTPTNLKVDKAKNNEVGLSWGTPNKPVDFKQYDIYRKSSSESNYAPIGTSAGENYTDGSARNGITYYYKIRSEDQNGNKSAYSNVVSAYVVDTLPPAVPAIVDYWADDHYVKLIWNRNTTDSDLAGYNVYYSLSSTGPFTKANSSLISQPSAGNPYYEITGLTNDLSYFFFVSALDTWKPTPNESARSGYQEIIPGHGVEMVSVNGNTNSDVEIDPYGAGANKEAVVQYYTRNICDWSVLSVLNAASNAEVYRSSVINPHMYMKADVQEVINTIPLLYWDCRSSTAGNVGEIVPAGRYKVHIEAGRGLMSSGSDFGLASVSVMGTSSTSSGGKWWKWWDYNLIVKGISYDNCRISLSSYLDKVPANNSTQSTITAVVTDSNGSPLKNTLIKFSTDIGNIDTDQNMPGNQTDKQTDSDGKVSAYYSCGVLGAANIKAEIASTPAVYGTIGIDVINVQITPDPASTFLGIPIQFSVNATDASGGPVFLSSAQWTMDNDYNVLINNTLYPRHLTGGGKTCSISFKYKGVVFDSVNVSILRPSRLGDEHNEYDSIIIDAADKYGAPPQLLKAQIHQESGAKFNLHAYRYEPYYDYQYISTMYNQPNILSYPFYIYAVEGIDSTSRTIPKGVALPGNYLDVLRDYSELPINIIDSDPSDDYGITVWDLCKYNPNMRWDKPPENFTAQVVVSASYGLAQVMYPTSVCMNFTGTPQELFSPSRVIGLGVEWLTKFYYNTGNWDSDWNYALSKYNGPQGYDYANKVRKLVINYLPK